MLTARTFDISLRDKKATDVPLRGMKFKEEDFTNTTDAQYDSKLGCRFYLAPRRAIVFTASTASRGASGRNCTQGVAPPT